MKIKTKLGLLVSLVLLVLLSPSPALAQTSAMETTYNALSNRFEGRDKLLYKDLKNYLQAYPYTTFVDEVHFMQAVLLCERGQYKQGLKLLEQLDPKALSRTHSEDYRFYRGYALLMMEEYQKASVFFGACSKTERYAVRGKYYYAYCMYKTGDYDKALPALEALESEPAYSKSIPYYLAQIYFSKGNYDEAESRALTLLREQPDSENNGELHRMLGEIYYLKADYRQAVTHLTAYEQAASANKEALNRTDMYMLGEANYQLAAYNEAVKYLKKIKQEKDELSEAACLTMGHAYVALKQPELAKLAYQAAAGYKLTPAVTEEASYNYTLCTYQSSSALGESVRAFNEFLHRFPDSKYEDKVYRLLTDALMQSKNYAAAISTLDSIDHPTPKMLATKQYLRYQLGADNFLQGKMQQSIDWTTAVINHASESDRYTTEAYYLRAEANYRLRAYAACEADLKRFFARTDAKQSANYTVAQYLKGYTAFSQGHYDQAREAFSVFIDNALATDPTYPDALNRIGDCYFNARDFGHAISYYTQVSNLNASGADYALFQRGYALGLQHKYSEKINVLRELVRRYPKSDYADDGVYEIARAQLQMNDERSAILSYEQLLASYPHSALARKASLERAMLFRNLGQTDPAIAAYRATIEKYPATEEAYAALEALQALYVEQGRVNEYLEYTKSLAKVNMTVTTAEDSLIYAAAELQYMQADYRKATVSLSNYITRFCAGGRYCTTARYYLADSYYRLGQTTEALEQYKTLAEMSANPYQEEAALRAAEICYDKADYTCALEAFYRLHSLASNRENTAVARIGILRCSQSLNRHQAAIDIANQILSDTPVEEATKTEALYGRAKAYVALGQWLKAQPDLTALAADVRTAYGAEAEYLLAQGYYEMGLLDEAEDQIMAFTQMNTQQQYWLARALILLSDIKTKQGDTFQARQYLLVLQQNYTVTGDDIPALVSDRIALLDQLDQPQRKEDLYEEE